MEDHLYTCIYDIQKSDNSPERKLASLNRYRAKLIRLQARQTEHLQLDASECDMTDGEETTLYHLIKSTKRREARTIRRTQDQGGRITDDPNEIAHIFVTHLKDEYSPIDIADSCIAEMMNAIRPHTQHSYAAYLEQPITAEELYTALKSGAPTNRQDRKVLVGNSI
jgi:hypothetical protein